MNTDFELAYRQVKNPLYAFALDLTRQPVEAKELLQETLLRAFRSYNRFVKGTNFLAWTKTIMRNCFINEYRRINRQGRHLDRFAINGAGWYGKAVENEGLSELAFEELQAVVDKLPDLYRIPFLKVYEGYSYQEIADELDLPVGTVKSRVFVARRKLMDKLDRLEIKPESK